MTIPKLDDQLWIVTDGALRDPGLGATMYVTRGEKLLIAGHFSAKLRKIQIHWLPCEIEALAIAAALKHFGPYIVQSSQKACVLTDSKPCVQAFEKLCRGLLQAAFRSLFVMLLGLLFSLQIMLVAMLHNVTAQHVRCVASSVNPWSLSCAALTLPTSCGELKSCPLPTEPHECLFRLSVQTSVGYAHIFSRVHVLPRELPTSKM